MTVWRIVMRMAAVRGDLAMWKNTLRAGLTLAVGVLALTACSTLQVHTDYDTGVDFTKYKTFDFLPTPDIAHTLVRDRAENAIARHLQGKGFTGTTESPDLVVALHGRRSREIQIDSNNFGYGWRGRGWAVGSSSATVHEIPVGTLIVDIVDAAAKKLVWQGTASDTLREDLTPQEREQRIDGAIAQLLAGFPPGLAK